MKQIDLNVLGKAIFENDNGLKHNLSFSQRDEIDYKLSHETIDAIVKHLQDNKDKDALQKLLFNTLSLCYLNNLNLNNIFTINVHEEI